jgi:HPt (histidine-containing phosphotransfer) domain-containing protein
MNPVFAVPLAANQQTVTEQFFNGIPSLYHAFRDSSMNQFPVDIEAIEAALKCSDWESLRRTAHNLKSALNMLGFECQAQQALKLELSACDSDLFSAVLAWHTLGSDLRQLVAAYQL